MAGVSHAPRPARAVAAVAPPVLADGAPAAQAWLVALVSATALEDVAALPTGQFAVQAPRLCAAVRLAVASDAELERLEAGGDRAALAPQAGALAGAGQGDAVAVARGVGLLRDAIWAVLLGRAGPARRRARRLDRRARGRVCDVVLQATLAPTARVRAGYGRGRRRSAVRSACRPAARPTWASSPTAATVVVSSSRPPSRSRAPSVRPPPGVAYPAGGIARCGPLAPEPSLVAIDPIVIIGRA